MKTAPVMATPSTRPYASIAMNDTTSLKMLSVKPADRPQSAADAYRALAAMQVHDARDKVVRLVSETVAAIEREQVADEITVAARRTA